MNGEMLEEVDFFMYLGLSAGKNGGVVEEEKSRVNEGAQISCTMNRIWKVRSLGIGVKRMMHEKIVVPTVIYGAKTWGLNVREKRRLNVKEMKCLRRQLGIGSGLRKLGEDLLY